MILCLNDLGILSFAIQITQPVDLKVYKANDDYCAELDEKQEDDSEEESLEIEIGQLFALFREAVMIRWRS